MSTFPTFLTMTHPPSHRIRRSLPVAFFAFVLLLLTACDPDPSRLNPINCLDTDPGGQYRQLVIPSGPGDTLLRSDDGTVRYGRSQDSTVGVGGTAGVWTLEASDGTETAVGPRCSAATRIDPDAPQPSFQWLPGATVEGEGARGVGQLSWPEVVHNGEPAKYIEVRRTVYNRTYGYDRQDVETFMFGPGARTIETTLDVDQQIFMRAWWDDGVSAQVEVEPPLQVYGDDVPRLFTTTDVAWLSPPPGNRPSAWARVSWEPTLDARGVAADRYQVVSSNNHDGVRPIEYTVEQEFDGATTSAFVRSTRNFLGGSIGMRAVWDDGGPFGGPQMASGAIGSPNPISNLASSNGTTTTSDVTFTTSTCTYGDYRIAVDGQPLFGAVIEEFNAPRDGNCYYNHGITIGVDTPPLTPNRTYNVTVVTIDAQTGEVHTQWLPVFTYN